MILILYIYVYINDILIYNIGNRYQAHTRSCFHNFVLKMVASNC